MGLLYLYLYLLFVIGPAVQLEIMTIAASNGIERRPFGKNI